MKVVEGGAGVVGVPLRVVLGVGAAAEEDVVRGEVDADHDIAEGREALGDEVVGAVVDACGEDGGLEAVVVDDDGVGAALGVGAGILPGAGGGVVNAGSGVVAAGAGDAGVEEADFKGAWLIGVEHVADGPLRACLAVHSEVKGASGDAFGDGRGHFAVADNSEIQGCGGGGVQRDNVCLLEAAAPDGDGRGAIIHS